MSSAAEPSVIKLGMVTQYLGPKCHARRLVCYLEVQGHDGIWFDKIWLFLPYLLNCWSFQFLQPNSIGWYIIISWSVLCKKDIVVFKVRNTVKVQNFIESLCILYLLYQWSLGSQSRCADLLFIITKPSTTKLAYTDSFTLTYTITRHKTGWGWGRGILLCKMTNLIF